MLTQVLQNQQIMMRQLDELQKQVSDIDHKLDVQHADVMRQFFYVQAGLNSIQQDTRALLQAGLGRALVFVENMQTARNRVGFQDAMSNNRQNFEEGRAALNDVCGLAFDRS